MGQVSPFVDDQDIQALVDNELDWEAEKRVRQYLSDNPKAQRRYDQLYKQKLLLRSWWQQSHQD